MKKLTKGKSLLGMLLTAVLLCALMVPVPVLAQEDVIDQQCGEPNTAGSSNICYCSPAGQEFTPSLDKLTRVDISGNVYNDGSTVTLNVRYATMEGEILTSATQELERNMGSDWLGSYPEDKWFSFDVPDISLVPGSVYVIEVVLVEGQQWSWGNNNGNPYPEGRAIRQGSIEEDRDWFFRTYGMPPTPTEFLISGEVNCTSGDPVSNPTVTVTNLATSEEFTVNTSADSNCYLTLTDSTHVSAGDTIRINAGYGSVFNETEHMVTNSDISEGGFEQDITLGVPVPDFTITKIALKTTGYANEENLLGVRVKNIGTANAGSFDVSLSIDGTQVLLETVASLAAGETTELEYTWTPDGTGEYALSATVDTNNNVVESDETNNDYARTSVIIKSTDWPQFNYDASGIGFSPSGAPSSDTVKWISEDINSGGGLSWGGISDMGPVVAEGKIFTYCGVEGFSSTPYDVACLDEDTGDLLWKVSLPYSMIYGSWAPLGYDDGMVFCTVNHYVVALDANDGSIVWECDLDSPEFEGHAWSVNGGPTIANGKVFAGTYDEGGIGGAGGLAGYVAIDEYTGEKLWQTTGDGHCDSTPAYYDGVVYAGFDHDWTASPSGGCYALDADTGEEVWRTWLPFSVWGSVSVDEDYVYGANYNFYGPAQVFILYRNNGTVKVISESLRTDSTPAVAYDNIYICGGCTGYSDTGTFCVDKETLEVIWSAPAGSWTASPAVADGKVYVGGFCYDAFTGDEIFSYEQGGLSPVIANGCLFNVQNGKVVCFEDIPFEDIPDLTVTAIETPAGIYVNSTVPISATVENIGDLDAASFDVRLEIDGSLVDVNTVSSLAAGGNTIVEFGWIPEAVGDYTLKVTADSNGVVDELDEGNNELTIDLEVRIPASIRIKPETLNLNDTEDGVFTAFVTLPDGYNVADINVGTLECEGAPALNTTISATDTGTLVVKFARANLVDVPLGDAVEMSVTGEMTDGTRFHGSDLVRVIAESDEPEEDEVEEEVGE